MYVPIRKIEQRMAKSDNCSAAYQKQQTPITYLQLFNCMQFDTRLLMLIASKYSYTRKYL